MTSSQLSHLKSLPHAYSTNKQSGFSLIEIAIVLVILGMLLAGILAPLSSQHAAQKRTSTENLLEDIRTALIGFAQANNGRLPCPASALSNGAPLPSNTSTVCTPGAGNRFVPYTVLGIRGNIVNGQLVDEWLRPIRYYLTGGYSTSPIQLSSPPAGTFSICQTQATCPSPSINAIANNVVVVLLSDGDPLSASPNPISNIYFYFDSPKATYDDIVVWIAQPELIYAISKTK